MLRPLKTLRRREAYLWPCHSILRGVLIPLKINWGNFENDRFWGQAPKAIIFEFVKFDVLFSLSNLYDPSADNISIAQDDT